MSTPQHTPAEKHMSEQQQDDIERLESTIATLRSRIAALELENTQAWTEVEKWKVIAIDSQADLEASNADLSRKLTASESRLAALERDGERVKELEGVIRKIWNEADQHWEYNPIGKVSRQPLGYVVIKSFAESVIAFPVTTHAPLSDAAQQADAATGKTGEGTL